MFEKHWGAEEWFLLISFLCIVGASVFFLTHPATQRSVAEWSEAWQDAAIRYGYLGTFIVSIIGNITVFSPLPYAAVVFFLAAFGLHPLWLGILTGLGATLGELVSYGVGWSGSSLFKRKRPASYQAIRAFVHRRPVVTQVLIVAFASLPLPDDMLTLPLGMIRYPLWHLIPAMLFGKILAGLGIAILGLFAHDVVFSTEISLGSVIMNAFLFLLFVFLIYALVKLPWAKILQKIEKNELPEDK